MCLGGRESGVGVVGRRFVGIRRWLCRLLFRMEIRLYNCLGCLLYQETVLLFSAMLLKQNNWMIGMS